jgi:tetratricopeptide (TPR) repeat protein
MLANKHSYKCLTAALAALISFGAAARVLQGQNPVVTADSGLVPIITPNTDNMEPSVQQQLREARNILNRTLAKPGASPTEMSDAYGMMGKLYHAYDLQDAAISCYADAQALDPSRFEWQYYLGAIYYAKADVQHAATYFAYALKIKPDDVPTLLHLAQAELDLNQTQQAQTLFQKTLTLDKSSSPAMVGLGKIALAARQYSAAVEHFKAALATDPEATSIEYLLAMAYRGLGDITHAQEHMLKRGSKEPRSPDPLIDGLADLKTGIGALWVRGNSEINSGHVHEAVKDFHQMVDLNPQDPTARMYLGMALTLAEDRHGAIEQYQAALQLAPANAGVNYNLGLLLAETGSEDQAIEHLRQAVKSNPQMTEANFQLANVLMRRGRYAEAATEYSITISMQPRKSFARLMEAMALIRTRHFVEARAKLEQGVAVLPGDADLITALARLLAGCPDKSVRDGPRALHLIQALIQKQQSFDLDQGQTLAMSLAAVGEFQRAAQLQNTMIGRLESEQRSDLAKPLRVNLSLYERGRPCLTPWPDDDPIFSPVPGKLETVSESSAPDSTSGSKVQN